MVCLPGEEGIRYLGRTHALGSGLVAVLFAPPRGLRETLNPNPRDETRRTAKNHGMYASPSRRDYAAA
ncbi:hypothetical protein CGRA01v4_00955 [Colletotrichum graminicola]|nr:hypothetical protein CGRA01v4_00955 [Colletotrichum graminicola]